jgi:hypothetical protein
MNHQIIPGKFSFKREIQQFVIFFPSQDRRKCEKRWRIQ